MTVTVHLPDDLAARLAAEAARRGQGLDEVAAELLADRLPLPAEAQGGRRRLAFAGVGSSGPEGGDIARRHRQLLADAFSDKSARDA